MGGSVILASISLGSGFIKDKIAIFVLRALAGIGSSWSSYPSLAPAYSVGDESILKGGALTVPSALNLMVRLLPNPQEQARAIAVFGGSGAVGNGKCSLLHSSILANSHFPFLQLVSGVFVGGVLAQYASWRWVFWLVALLAGLTATISSVLIPSHAHDHATNDDVGGRPKKPDYFGFALFGGSLILFVYALTSGSANGWGSAAVLSTLIISIICMGLFFLWENKINETDAALYVKFSVLSQSAFDGPAD